ncbi:hypothetical protein YC2023_011720 [Brassica napus]
MSVVFKGFFLYINENFVSIQDSFPNYVLNLPKQLESCRPVLIQLYLTRKLLIRVLLRSTTYFTPATKKSNGRPPTKRIRSVGEFGVPGSKSQSHKSSRCGIGGHNKGTCKTAI